MAVIRKGNISNNNIKKLKDLKKFLSEPMRNDIWFRKIRGWEQKFSNDVDRTFVARTNWGLPRDRLLNEALRVKINKDNIIVWVAPIRRDAKISGFSSGGQVNNLTAILFNGSRGSYGGYYRPWDARTQSGYHKGTSPSKMRNMWKNYRNYIHDQIGKTLSQLIRKKLKGAS